MGMIKEFKEFAMRGNVVDMAAGIVIGSAFGAIVNEIVGQIITPIVGYMQGGVDFKDKVYKLPVPELAEGVAGPTIGYGAVLQALLNFIIVAFVLFLVIKGMNTLNKKAEKPAAATPEDVLLLREIRDSLAQR